MWCDGTFEEGLSQIFFQAPDALGEGGRREGDLCGCRPEGRQAAGGLEALQGLDIG